MMLAILVFIASSVHTSDKWLSGLIASKSLPSTNESTTFSEFTFLIFPPKKQNAMPD